MAYSTEISATLTNQLRRFVTLNRHQLAGHVANLDFWLAETRHCLEVIDGYRKRFDRLKAAEAGHVAAHETIAFSARTPYFDDVRLPPSTPKRIADGELKSARRELCDAAYHFLLRCFREQCLDAAAVRRHCDGLGIGVDPADLKPN